MGRALANNKAGNEETRQRIVDAAIRLFTRYGFKRTSVDWLAREANVAKPTIYAYFQDKEAVFRAVVVSACAAILQEARTASGASIEERVAAMLSAKFTRYWELVQSSPHAPELIDSQSRLGAEIVQESDRVFRQLLARTLAQARELRPARLGLTAGQAAQLLIRAASGAAYDATSAAQHRRFVAETVRVLLAAFRD
jgi:AcrR family transcriptional regulator